MPAPRRCTGRFEKDRPAHRSCEPERRSHKAPAGAQGQRKRPRQPWLRNLLGDDFFTLVISAGFHSGEQITDAALANVAGLTHLQMLRLGGTRITDAALAQIATHRAASRLYPSLLHADVLELGIGQGVPVRVLRGPERRLAECTLGTGRNSSSAPTSRLSPCRCARCGRSSSTGAATIIGCDPRFVLSLKIFDHARH